MRLQSAIIISIFAFAINLSAASPYVVVLGTAYRGQRFTL